MAIRLQLRRGTTAQNKTFTGAAGELTYDTQKHIVRVHNNSTAGGFPIGGVMDVVEIRGVNNAVSGTFGGWRIEYGNGFQEYIVEARRDNTDTVTFDTPFNSDYYNIQATCQPGNNSGPRFATITSRNANQFTFNLADDSSWNNDGWCWFRVFGQKAA